jgi:hypothetical protein
MAPGAVPNLVLPTFGSAYPDLTGLEVQILTRSCSASRTRSPRPYNSSATSFGP